MHPKKPPVNKTRRAIGNLLIAFVTIGCLWAGPILDNGYLLFFPMFFAWGQVIGNVFTCLTPAVAKVQRGFGRSVPLVVMCPIDSLVAGSFAYHGHYWTAVFFCLAMVCDARWIYIRQVDEMNTDEFIFGLDKPE